MQVLGNKQWPELIGLNGEDAKKKIEAENQTLHVQVLELNAPCTRDYRLDRVRIFVD
jgi:hypothetical protein